VVKALLQSLVLSLIIEILFLAAPFYVQLAIDDAIVKGDPDFMGVLAIAFTTLLVFRIVATCIRALTLQFISQVLSFDMQSRIFHHMLRLPLQWFHKRNIGDIQSRFGAIQPIKAFIANGAIAGFLDGILASLVLILMMFYSVKLSFVVLASIILYLLIRVSSIQLQRRVAGDAIVTQALEQSRFLESVRAMETVKSLGAEVLREGQQRNAMAASINSSIRSGNVQIGYSTIAQLIDGLTDIIVIYWGAIAVIQNTISLGMLTAFIAYKQQFASRLTNLLEQIVTWRLLSVDLERLSDIALSPAEQIAGGIGFSAPILGALECRMLRFSYAYGEAPVLSNVSFNISPGEYVAIVGASGCGKSTLIKLLAGLYQPSSGEVILDGHPINSWDKRVMREQIAIVTQDDNLLAGSIADNIATFDSDVDMRHVRLCAQLAHIDGDIAAMPMGYDTLVGDLGSSLSGGQKQRVLIARALYRRPRILILDEGTSHLDIPNEQAINDALGLLNITRIVVAHRPETMMAATRRLTVAGGRIVGDESAPPPPQAS
jgi:ATP-binding cassette subfamily B protein RaxB